jgi:hypothetical protein
MAHNEWTLTEGTSPIVMAAIHCGHVIRPEIAEWISLNDSERLREEDPFTDRWTTLVDNQIIGHNSRFEVDLNRPRSQAVYVRPEDAWGLQVWRQTPPDSLIESSLTLHDQFYSELHSYLNRLVESHGRVVIYDLHSYNHRRGGPESDAADPGMNPEINLGTGTMYRRLWVGVVDRFLGDLSQYDFMGRSLDVRENVKFRGGYFPKWIHEEFPNSACVLSIEVKKFFMDEWTGQPNPDIIEAIGGALSATIPGVLEELERL